MCGYKQCNLMDFYHSSFIQFHYGILKKMKSKVDYLPYVSSPHSITNYQRVLYYIEVCDSEGRTRFPRPRDAALHLLWKAPDRDDDDEVLENLTYFHCANDTCVRCPNYKITAAESNCINFSLIFCWRRTWIIQG